MVAAGTKYLAISLVSMLGPTRRIKIFLLISPSRHLPPAANTPEPELPVVATSWITAGMIRTTRVSLQMQYCGKAYSTRNCVRTQLLRRMLAELESALDAVQAGLDAVEARVDAGHAAAD